MKTELTVEEINRRMAEINAQEPEKPTAEDLAAFALAEAEDPSETLSLEKYKVQQERLIPFEITAEPAPFYSEANMRYLEKTIADIESGRAKLVEHELIEVE